jgi:glycosyltransferase involved in cell wall biosynthesis
MAEIKRPIREAAMGDKSFDAAAVLVALPVFNELEYLDDVLCAVHKYSDNILVVDDGSTDGGYELLKAHSYIKLVSHQKNIGYGRSLIEAFEFARQKSFEWVITVDCDFQHEPSYIPHFYREIEKDDIDIISGSRYLCEMDSGMLPPPAERIAINKKITGLLNDNLGLRLTDAFCGFKAYRTSAISRLNLSEQGYGLPLQLWIQASRAGLRIREIPVPLIYHDPKRKFCGPLEDPKRRLDYYLEVIEKELEYDADRNIKGTLRS